MVNMVTGPLRQQQNVICLYFEQFNDIKDNTLDKKNCERRIRFPSTMYRMTDS